MAGPYLRSIAGALPPFEGASLFSDMPGPEGRYPDEAEGVLQETCYQCHTGDVLDPNHPADAVVAGEGTVLARTAAERVLESKEEQPDGSKTVTLSKGTVVSCGLRHENKL